jgi:hypothetical protein
MLLANAFDLLSPLVLGAVGGFLALALCAFLVVQWVKWKFHKIVHESVLEAGSALKDAQVAVHAVRAVPAPAGPSPYDLDEDDEQYCPEVDGQPWGEDDGHYYSIDVTITPADPGISWDPTGLAVVPADFEPDDPTDLCEQMGGLHSAEVWKGDGFQPLPECEVRGPKRVRLLMGVPEGVRAVKFANLVTYFGHVDLPEPLKIRAGK